MHSGFFIVCLPRVQLRELLPSNAYLTRRFLAFSIESIENPIIYLVGFSFVINCFEPINKIKCNYFT